MIKVNPAANRTMNSSSTAFENSVLSARYREVVLVGKGTYGTVWKATDEHLGRTVAIKQIALESSNRPLIEKEVRLLASLNHPNILRLLDVIQDKQYVYLIQPFCAHGTLEEWIQFQNPPNAIRVSVLQRVLDAVEYLHSRGWVHADIKPANIFIDDRNYPFLSDFGIASKVSDGQTRSGDSSVPMQWAGTTGYMSPELLRQETLPTIASDIYALGITLFEALSGKNAFASDRSTALQQSLNSKVPSIDSRNLESRADWNAIIAKATAEQPSARYSSTVLMLDDMKRLLQKRPLQAQKRSRVQHVRKWVAREPWLAGLAMGFFAVAILGTIISASAWRTAANNLTLVQTEERNLEKALREIQLTRTKLSESIEAVRTATKEALEQETLAKATVEEIAKLKTRSQEAKVQGENLQSESDKALDQSIDRLRAYIKSIPENSVELRSPEIVKQLEEAKRNLATALITRIQRKHKVSTLPQDIDNKLIFLEQIEKLLSQNQKVAIGQLKIYESERSGVVFQSTIHPVGFFVTNWDDISKPLSFFHPAYGIVDVTHDGKESSLIDVGAISFSTRDEAATNADSKDSQAMQCKIVNADGIPIKSNRVVIFKKHIVNSKSFDKTLWNVLDMVSNAEGTITIPKSIYGTWNVFVYGHEVRRDLDIAKLQQDAESTITLTRINDNNPPLLRLGKINLMELTSFTFTAVNKRQSTNITSISLLPKGRFLVSWETYSGVGIGIVDSQQRVIKPVREFKRVKPNDVTENAIDGLQGLDCCVATSDGTIFFCGEDTDQGIYQFQAKDTTMNRIERVLKTKQRSLFVSLSAPSDLFVIRPDRIDRLSLPISRESSSDVHCLSSDGYLFKTMLDNQFVLANEDKPNKGESKTVLIDLYCDGYFETDLEIEDSFTASSNTKKVFRCSRVKGTSAEFRISECELVKSNEGRLDQWEVLLNSSRKTSN